MDKNYPLTKAIFDSFYSFNVKFEIRSRQKCKLWKVFIDSFFLIHCNNYSEKTNRKEILKIKTLIFKQTMASEGFHKGYRFLLCWCCCQISCAN